MSTSTARVSPETPLRRPLELAQARPIPAAEALPLHPLGVPAKPGLPRSAEGAPALGRELADRLAALLLLVLAAPLAALLALLVRLTSPGPVLFVQRRVGLDGRSFRMLKFRSMVDGAERQEDALAGRTGPGPFFKVRSDPRLTPLGRWLRKSSLDELPQLWNVLKGEMRLVGPRPLLLREHRALPPAAQGWRVSVKPGLTGLWQVSGRSRTSTATRLRLDRLYVERSNAGLDLLILARTPRAVFRADGAV